MKNRAAFIMSAMMLLSVSCGGNQKNGDDTSPVSPEPSATAVELKDYGSDPTVLDIETYTLANDNFRTVLWTGENLQVTLMSIPAGGDIGLEVHPDVDQFMRIEKGKGKVTIGDSRESLDFVREAGENFAVFVPAGK